MLKINDETIFHDAVTILTHCYQRLQPFLDGDSLVKSRNSLSARELTCAKETVSLCGAIVSSVFGDESDFGEKTLAFIYQNEIDVSNKVFAKAQQEAIEKDEANSTDDE